MKTIAILGGGASGMAAALAARETLDNEVLLLERQSRVGRKLLATGNGRCNLTNLHALPERYHGEDPAFAVPALTRCDPDRTLSWFASLGLLTRAEPSGRVYPLSDAAGSVVDALRLAMDARGVTTVCGFTAAEVRLEGGRFTVASDTGKTVECDKLIVACGGMAGAKLGGVRDGYDLLASLGHKCTGLHPSLVQLKTDNTWTRAMKGVRTQAGIALIDGNTTLAEARGEVQFTDYGVTGPGIYDISRSASLSGEGAILRLRLLPELNEVDIINYFIQKQENFPNYMAENLLTGTLHNTICRTFLRRAGIPADTRLWALSEEMLRELAALVTAFDLPLIGTLGFTEAQVTAGGMETSDFDPVTMESRLVSGLYACGEVLDIDGDCGGFNLQWAWSSGRAAGLAAAGLTEEAL